jgi:hypothetical protein
MDLLDLAKQFGTWLAALVALGGTMVIFIQGLIAVVKTTFPNLPRNYLPGISLGLGCLIGAVVSFVAPVQLPLALGLCAGVVGGLMASKLWGDAAAADLAREQTKAQIGRTNRTDTVVTTTASESTGFQALPGAR